MSKPKATEAELVEPDLMELAKVAYLAYFASKQGDKDAIAPEFDNLMAQSKTAWSEAAAAVRDAIAAFILKQLQLQLGLEPEVLSEFLDRLSKDPKALIPEPTAEMAKGVFLGEDGTMLAEMPDE